MYRDIKSDKMARVFKDPFLKRKRFDFEDKTNLTHNRYPLQFENSEFFCWMIILLEKVWGNLGKSLIERQIKALKLSKS